MLLSSICYLFIGYLTVLIETSLHLLAMMDQAYFTDQPKEKPSFFYIE